MSRFRPAHAIDWIELEKCYKVKRLDSGNLTLLIKPRLVELKLFYLCKMCLNINQEDESDGL